MTAPTRLAHATATQPREAHVTRAWTPGVAANCSCKWNGHRPTARAGAGLQRERAQAYSEERAEAYSQERAQAYSEATLGGGAVGARSMMRAMA
jgi:hypothetical protein